MVTYKSFAQEAVAPIQMLSHKVEDIASAVFGAPDALYAEDSFWSKQGTVTHVLQRISDRLNILDEEVAQLSLTGPSTVMDQLQELEKRMANGLRAAALRSAGADQALEERIVRLEEAMARGSAPFGSQPPSPNAHHTHALAAPAPSSLDASLGEIDGVPITLRSLMDHINTLEAARGALRRELDQLKAATHSTGVRLGDFAFDAIESIIEQLQVESVDPSAFATHVDHVSLFAHYANGTVDTGANTIELRAMRSAGINDPTCCHYIASFRQEHPPYLLEGGGPVGVTQRFPMLKTRAAWEGRAVLDGGRARLKKAVKDAYTLAKTYAATHLTAGSQTRALADLCAQLSYEWWIAACTHLDDEILALTQYGIPEDKVFGLVSDEIKVMLRQSFAERMKMPVFGENRDPMLYYATSIWVTLHAHQVMAEFNDLGFASHVLISSLFTRFLAEQTGANLGAGVTAHITRLEAEIKKLRNELTSKATAINGRLDKMDPKIKNLEATCNRS